MPLGMIRGGGHTHDGVDPEDPAVSDVVRDEPHDEGSGGRAKRHHQPVMWLEWGCRSQRGATYVQIPMCLPRSFLKNVSTTTPLPIAMAGLMKNDTRHRHTDMAA